MRSDALKKIVLTVAFPLEAGGGKTDRIKAPHEWIEGRPELLPPTILPAPSLSLLLSQRNSPMTPNITTEEWGPGGISLASILRKILEALEPSMGTV